VVALEYSLAGYTSLDVLEVADPFAPRLVCTVNNSPYPLQPVQWLSASKFLLLLTGPPNQLVDVNVASASITTFRELNGSVYLAALSPDRAWMATMESAAGDTRVARLYGPGGVQTLATYPPAAGHGGTFYGFGGPKIEFSSDGSMLLTVDYEANFNDATVSDLQVFDLNGTRLTSAARGLWAVWDEGSVYYDGGDHKVFRWVRGSAPVAILQSGWLESTASGQSIGYLVYGLGGWGLNVLDTKSGVVTTMRASGQRIYPLFVNGAVIWSSELVDCACFGGKNPTGKVFAYDPATGSERAVTLPNLLAPLAGASLSNGP
jgi:hypothetical protein